MAGANICRLSGTCNPTVCAWRWKEESNAVKCVEVCEVCVRGGWCTVRVSIHQSEGGDVQRVPKLPHHQPAVHIWHAFTLTHTHTHAHLLGIHNTDAAEINIIQVTKKKKGNTLWSWCRDWALCRSHHPAASGKSRPSQRSGQILRPIQYLNRVKENRPGKPAHRKNFCTYNMQHYIHRSTYRKHSKKNL